jgi:hypothetical protein
MFGGIVYGLVRLVSTVPDFGSSYLFFSVWPLRMWYYGSRLHLRVSASQGWLIATVTPAFQWLHAIFFFHAALWGACCEWATYLREVKASLFTMLDDCFVSCSCFSVCYIQYGVELDLPAATILSMFRVRAQVFSSFLHPSFDRCSHIGCVTESAWLLTHAHTPINRTSNTNFWNFQTNNLATSLYQSRQSNPGTLQLRSRFETVRSPCLCIKVKGGTYVH